MVGFFIYYKSNKKGVAMPELLTNIITSNSNADSKRYYCARIAHAGILTKYMRSLSFDVVDFIEHTLNQITHTRDMHRP